MSAPNLLELYRRCLAGDRDVLARFCKCGPRPRWSVTVKPWPARQGESYFAFGLRIAKQPGRPATMEWAIYRLDRDGPRERWSVLRNAAHPRGPDEVSRTIEARHAFGGNAWQRGESLPPDASQPDLFDSREAGAEYAP